MTDEPTPLPPATERIRPLSGTSVFFIEQYEVAEFHPTPDGTGPATQVHLVITVRGFAAPLVLRIMNRGAADTLIASLQRHRDSVWPPTPRK
jgi:hypothetical protein